jgi:hypothetical protein
MIHYFNGADELILEYPKANPKQWNANEKYYRVVTGYGSGNSPEYADAVNNPDWNSSEQLEVKKNELRKVRDGKLSETDYIFIRQQEQAELQGNGKGSKNKKKLSTGKYNAVVEYRQDLRNTISDITTWQHVKDLSWATKPDTSTE